MSVAFTGAGGKSAALGRLAREARGRHPILLTTTTRLAISQQSLADSHHVVLSVADAESIPFQADRSILVTGRPDPMEGKLLAPAPEALETLRKRFLMDGALVAIEADGARGRWVKAPAEHEPLIPSWVDVVVPVAGWKAVGEVLDSRVAHRPELVAQALGISEGEPLTPRLMGALLSSSRGGLKGIPPGAEVRALLNGAVSEADKAIVQEVSAVVLGAERIRALLTGDLDSDDPVRYLTSRVAGIILAGGAGARLRETKPIAEWKGRPLVSHVIRAARQGGLKPIVVVLGSQAAKVRAALAAEDVAFVDNPAWNEGQSSSVQAGLDAVEADVEGAVFLLADMPLVSADTIGRLVEGHARTLAAIVAPVGAGRRGNPVLFDRRVFPALHALSGDQGGRSLLERWEWQAVSADPAEFFEVDDPGDLETLRSTE
jgi:molybdenum cofactor cytidylyltransferase